MHEFCGMNKNVQMVISLNVIRPTFSNVARKIL